MHDYIHSGKQPIVLVIEDDEETRSVLKECLEGYGYCVEVSDCAKDGIARFLGGNVDVVISDLRLPDVSGIEVLRAIKRADENSIVFIVTGFGSVDTAVDALEQGAFDYFVKPVNFKHLDIVIRRALIQRDLVVASVGGPRESLCGMVGASPEMNRIYTQILVLAKTDLTVLILGETGTGKEMVARAIHELGDRKKGPFIAVNCGTLPEPLLESELFGYVKGAYTGALSDKRGLFDAATGGTILLDELESASLHTQTALLRVLDSKEVRPVGSTSNRTANVRVIAASNKDLDSLVRKGGFREDLLYRLLSAMIRVPPLRDRVEDIPALVNHFAKEYEGQNKRVPRKFSPKALELMTTYPWPGNVRELKYAVQHAVRSSQREIVRPADLPASVRQATTKPDEMSLAEVQRQHVQKALQLTNWNKSKAAKLLGVRRSVLYSLIAKYQLSMPS